MITVMEHFDYCQLWSCLERERETQAWAPDGDDKVAPRGLAAGRCGVVTISWYPLGWPGLQPGDGRAELGVWDTGRCSSVWLAPPWV